MKKGKRFFNRFSESYIDTLAKLYHYSTSVYSKNAQSVLCDTDLRYTYGQFRRTCDGLSRSMSCYGIGSGTGIALLGQSMPNWGIAFFSAVAFGRVIIPILPDSSENEVRNILEHSEAKVLFVSRKLASKVPADCLEKMTLVYDLDTLSVIRRDDNAFTCDGRTAEPNADDLAALIYTSGTTGKAKGVMLSHRNLVHNVFASYHTFKTNEKDKWLSILPMAHTYEMSIGFLYPFFVGASVYYLSRNLATATLLKTLRIVKPTIMLSVPLIIEKVVNSSVLPTIRRSKTLSWMDKHIPCVLYSMIGGKLKKTFGGKMRFFGIGGAQLSETVEAVLRKTHFPYAIGYGMTEAAPLICGAAPKETCLGSCGTSTWGVQVKLVDVNPETGDGELVARGDNIMLGYYKDPSRTKAMFTSDGFLRTNDLAAVDSKGRYYIKGRLNNMILGPSGENIYPEEIEDVINQMDIVNESIVVDRDGKLVALVKLDDSIIDWKNVREADELIDKIHSISRNIKDTVNHAVNKSSRISEVEIMKEPFQKTASMKIRRFLYKKSSNPDAGAAEGETHNSQNKK